MVEQLAQIGLNIEHAINKLGHEIHLGNLISSIPLWNGNPSQIDDFLRAVEATRNPASTEYSLTKSAHLRTTGLAKEVLSKYLSETASASITWSAAKKLLIATFEGPRDSRTALEKMRKIRQSSEMSLAVYAQLILNELPYAFPDMLSADPLIQRELISVFIKWLMNPRVKNKVIISDPQTLSAALTAATNESKIQARINAFRTTPTQQTTKHDHFSNLSQPQVLHEPMDCTHLSTPNTVQNTDSHHLTDPYETAQQHGYPEPSDEYLTSQPEFQSDQQMEPLYEPSYDPEEPYDPDDEFDYDESNVYALSSGHINKACFNCGSQFHLVRNCPRFRQPYQHNFQPRSYQYRPRANQFNYGQTYRGLYNSQAGPRMQQTRAPLQPRYTSSNYSQPVRPSMRMAHAANYRSTGGAPARARTRATPSRSHFRGPPE